MTSEDDTYVHRPGDIEDGDGGDGQDQEHGRGQSADQEHGREQPADQEHGRGQPAEREFDWRGWLLVGILFVAFVVAPVTIYLVPLDSDMYLTVLIVMPLLPALLLAVVAVWATARK